MQVPLLLFTTIFMAIVAIAAPILTAYPDQGPSDLSLWAYRESGCKGAAQPYTPVRYGTNFANVVSLASR